jgi:hypothetical protein
MAYEGWANILQKRYDYGSSGGQQSQRESLEDLRKAQQDRLNEIAGRFQRPSGAPSPVVTPSNYNSQFAQGAVTSYNNQQDIAKSLGLWDEIQETGKGAFGGLVDGTINTLDALRGASMGYMSGTLNTVGQVGEQLGIDNPLDEWTADPYDPAAAGDDYKDASFGNSAFGRAWAGFTNDKEWGAGDFNGPLKVQDGDNGLTRAAKLGAAFVTDTAFDPLTYLTFGVGSIGKKGAQEGLEAVAKLTAKGLDDEAATALASRSTIGREINTALEAGDRTTAAQRLTSVLGREVKEDAVDIELADPTFVRELAGSALTDEAVDAYVRRSSRGLRDYLQTSGLDSKTAQNFWQSLPVGARGGVRLAIPFTKQESGAILRSSMLDRVGLGKVADGGSRMSLWLRTTAPVSALRRNFSGASGKAWDQYLQRTASNLDASYTRDYSGWARIARENRATRTHLNKMSELALRDVAEIVDATPGDNDKILGSAQRFLAAGVTEAPTKASDIDRGGFLVAEAFRKVLDQRWQELQARGLDVAKIKDYWPRVVTEDYMAAKAKTKSLRGAKGTGPGGYQPDKAREAFQTLIGQDREGNLLFKWDSLDEANRLAKEAGMPGVFETDPFKVLSQYLASTDRMMATADLTKAMERAGILYTGERSIVRFLNDEAIAGSVTAARQTLNDVRNEESPDAWFDVISLGGTDAEKQLLAEAQEAAARQVQVDDLTRQLDNVLTSDRDVVSFLRMAPTGDPKALDEYVNNLVVVLHDITELKRAQVEAQVKYLRGKGETALADKVRTAYAEELASVTKDKLTSTRKVGSKIDESLPDFGRLNAPKANGKLPELTGLPRSWDDETLVPDAIREAVQDHFTRMPSRPIIDDFYAPFLSAWKMSATIGRGPGYHVRNAIGAFWNNFLTGVTGKDYKTALRMAKARAKAEEFADRQMRKSGKGVAGWEKAYWKKFNELVGGDKDLVAYERAWQTSGMGNNNFNLERMGVNLTEAATGGQLLDQAARGGRTRFTRGPAVDLFVRSSNPNTRTKRALNKAANNPWFKVSSRVSNVAEDYVRTAAFLRGIDVYGLDDGGSAAATMVRATQFDYGDLSPFERDVVRMIVPFYTWTRNNVPLQVRALFLDPRKPMAAMRLQDGLEDAYGYDYENDPDAKPWDELLPSYSVDRQGFAVDPRWVPDFLESEDGPLVLQMESPLNDVNALIPSNPLDARSWIEKAQTVGTGSLSPALKAPMSLMFNTDLSTGAKFSEKGMPATSWAKALGLTFSDVDDQGVVEERMSPFVGVLGKELLPPLGIVDRLYTGPGANDASVDRATSNWGSFFGAPVRTATEEQMGGTARTIYEKRKAFLEQKTIEHGLNLAEISDFVTKYPAGPQRDAAIEKVKVLVSQGYFRLPPQPE